jgi:hypothetical protein
MDLIKRGDTDISLHSGSRLSKHWGSTEEFQKYWQFFSGRTLSLGREKASDPYFVRDRYKLRGFEYGNWVTVEDRYNYLIACYIALEDMSDILGFTNLGMNGTIGIAFGARGSSTALAHFEPGSFMINLTRYRRDKKAYREIHRSFGLETKQQFFLYTGGVGSLAHEYGHALDYFFGTFVHQHPSFRSLSFGRSTLTHFKPQDVAPKGTLRRLMAELIHAVIWADHKQSRHSDYYKRLDEYIQQRSEYWYRHNELFARVFETWVAHRLQKSGITNKFLTKMKYDHAVYPTQDELKRLMPYMNRLMKAIAAKVKTKTAKR